MACWFRMIYESNRFFIICVPSDECLPTQQDIKKYMNYSKSFSRLTCAIESQGWKQNPSEQYQLRSGDITSQTPNAIFFYSAPSVYPMEEKSRPITPNTLISDSSMAFFFKPASFQEKGFTQFRVSRYRYVRMYVVVALKILVEK